MRKKLLIGIVLILVISLPIYFFVVSGNKDRNEFKEEKQLYTCGMHPQIISDKPGNCPICEMKLVPVKQNNQTKGERKILFYRHPMNPEIISDHPQKDEMGMDFVPVYEDEISESGIVKIDPEVQQKMNVKTAKVETKELSARVITNGILQTDETREFIVNTRLDGWIEKLYVNFTGQLVQKGSKLMDIYSPELVSAQQELLTALSYQKTINQSSIKSIKESGNELVRNAIKKLELLEIPEAEIQRLIETKELKTTMTLYAKRSGTVIEKNIVEGEKIMAGMPLLKIADLSNLWLVADVYEYELSKISVGSRAFISFKFLPGKIYEGKVSFIYPLLDEKTRTVKVRIDVPNRGELKPAMFANVTIEGKSTGKKPVVPENAVIRTGLKDFVIIALGEGKFKPQEVKLGIYSDGYYQVLDGLIEGNSVVTSAQFLIDSESNLRQIIQKFQSSSDSNTSAQSEHKSRSQNQEKKSKTEKNYEEHNYEQHSIIRKGVIDLKAIDKNKDGKLWQCPMDWNVISDEKGQCPICEMKLKKFTIDEVKVNLEKAGFKYKK